MILQHDQHVIDYRRQRDDKFRALMVKEHARKILQIRALENLMKVYGVKNIPRYRKGRVP